MRDDARDNATPGAVRRAPADWHTVRSQARQTSFGSTSRGRMIARLTGQSLTERRADGSWQATRTDRTPNKLRALGPIWHPAAICLTMLGKCSMQPAQGTSPVSWCVTNGTLALSLVKALCDHEANRPSGIGYRPCPLSWHMDWQPRSKPGITLAPQHIAALASFEE